MTWSMAGELTRDVQGEKGEESREDPENIINTLRVGTRKPPIQCWGRRRADTDKKSSSCRERGFLPYYFVSEQNNNWSVKRDSNSII